MGIYKVFNINENIKVKLTDYGKEIYSNYLKSRYDDMISKNIEIDKSYLDIKYDNNGYIDFQLCIFMNIFGNYFKMGMNNMIIENNEIYINEIKFNENNKRIG